MFLIVSLSVICQLSCFYTQVRMFCVLNENVNDKFVKILDQLLYLLMEPTLVRGLGKFSLIDWSVMEPKLILGTAMQIHYGIIIVHIVQMLG